MMMKPHVSRNALDFFLQKADSIQVRCDLGRIFIDICMEHNSGGRLDRCIGIAKDEEGFVRLNCYEDWGDGEQGSASIEDDELKALLEFLPAFIGMNDHVEVKETPKCTENIAGSGYGCDDAGGSPLGSNLCI